MIKIKINNIKVNCFPNTTIIQACILQNIIIPSFCYHTKLNIAGNCRMCLVEINKAPKPVAACSFPISQGLEIKTNSSAVKKAREAIMEFLLLNHPLDCPICDQGGECDLQEQSFNFGSSFSRYRLFNKRSVQDKYCGPIIKTIMNRCIHCTRCVRFSSDIAGNFFFGTFGRGVHTEISTFNEKAFLSEISGNVIDLCPVGALTSKFYAFRGRPWDLDKFNTYDPITFQDENLQIEIKNTNIIRISSEINENLNSEWISDDIRFFFDILNNNRLLNPSYKQNTLIKTTPINYNFYLKLKNNSFLNNKKYQNLKIKAFLATPGDLINISFDSFFSRIYKFAQFKYVLHSDFKFNNINSLISLKILSQYHLILMFHNNIRVYSPVLNVFFFILNKVKSCKFFLIGSYNKFNYLNYSHVSLTSKFFYTSLLFTSNSLKNFFNNNSDLLKKGFFKYITESAFSTLLNSNIKSFKNFTIEKLLNSKNATSSFLGFFKPKTLNIFTKKHENILNFNQFLNLNSCDNLNSLNVSLNCNINLNKNKGVFLNQPFFFERSVLALNTKEKTSLKVCSPFLLNNPIGKGYLNLLKEKTSLINFFYQYLLFFVNFKINEKKKINSISFIFSNCTFPEKTLYLRRSWFLNYSKNLNLIEKNYLKFFINY